MAPLAPLDPLLNVCDGSSFRNLYYLKLAVPLSSFELCSSRAQPNSRTPQGCCASVIVSCQDLRV